jgi:glycopeptide antibiotics resistance protein
VPGTFVAEVHAGPVLVPLLVGVVVVWLLALGHRRGLTWARTLTVLVATAYALGVVAVTFFPWQVPFGATDVAVGGAHGPGHEVALRSLLNVVPLITLDPPTFVLNIVMTLPLGARLPLLVRVRSTAAVALVGLLVSATIEVGQGVGDVLLGMTRTVDVNDLIANVTGTVLGLVVFRTVAAASGSALERFALPGSAVAAASGRSEAQTGPGWLVDDPDETTAYGSGHAGPPAGTTAGGAPLAGASTAITPAASRAVPKTRSPSSAYWSR